MGNLSVLYHNIIKFATNYLYEKLGILDYGTSISRALHKTFIAVIGAVAAIVMALV